MAYMSTLINHKLYDRTSFGFGFKRFLGISQMPVDIIAKAVRQMWLNTQAAVEIGGLAVCMSA